jgi:hypothetical protein
VFCAGFARTKHPTIPILLRCYIYFVIIELWGEMIIAKLRQIENNNRLITILILIIGMCSLAWAHYTFIPDGSDWTNVYRPAARLLLSGKSPYQYGGFFNPPWVLLPLLPFCMLPARVGGTFLFILNFSSIAFCGWKLGAKPVPLFLFLFAFTTCINYYNGQVDGILSLGFILPPVYGLFFVLIKPQLGLGLAIYWLFAAWQKGQIKEVIRVFAPVTITFGFSFLIFGPYFLQTINAGSGLWFWNQSLWPYSIPIGIGLFLTALRIKDPRISILAGPFLAPYVGNSTWGTALLGLSGLPIEQSLISISTWIVRFLVLSKYSN